MINALLPIYGAMNSRLAQRHKLLLKEQDEGKCIQKYYLNPQYSSNIYINNIGG